MIETTPETQSTTLRGNDMDESEEMVTCSKCGKLVDPLEVFPKRRCLECHAEEWRPSAEDFGGMVKAFRGGIIRK
jgi:hypothetical protein